MNAVLYIRVSTEEQVSTASVCSLRRSACGPTARHRASRSPPSIRDEGVSAAKGLATRPGGAELLGLVAAGSVRHVVALKLDRLFRNAEDALHQTTAWDRAGIALHLVDMGGATMNTGSAIGRMMLTMLAGFAEFERNLIAERTRQALEHKRGRREVYGCTPYGYTREGDSLCADADELATLARIRAWRAEGLSLRAIAARLTAAGTPTKRGGRWHPWTVSYLLKNELYSGEAVA